MGSERLVSGQRKVMIKAERRLHTVMVWEGLISERKKKIKQHYECTAHFTGGKEDRDMRLLKKGRI